MIVILRDRQQSSLTASELGGWICRQNYGHIGHVFTWSGWDYLVALNCFSEAEWVNILGENIVGRFWVWEFCKDSRPSVVGSASAGSPAIPFSTHQTGCSLSILGLIHCWGLISSVTCLNGLPVTTEIIENVCTRSPPHFYKLTFKVAGLAGRRF